ncbi:DUF6177 family protein [Microbacterium aurantiacum]|uniref:Uncharacterized protein n=1 Tax=Microbacterium aurantiacum TaxID=162393 RepID=A0ABT8FUC8_9MICO|nr:DUF6177 family protein [Microbacterium aurantiacum]MDN4464927.1 hypothetical protein [Microbacterium aurantiacum]
MGPSFAPHPLEDGAGPGWSATETRAPVIALTAGMSDYLHRVTGDGARAIVISGPHSRMTPVLADALAAVRGHWVIRTPEDPAAVGYDARTGRRLAQITDVLSATAQLAASDLHPVFLRAPISSRLQLVATISTRHRVSRPVRLGGVIEAATETLVDSTLSAWGPTEPLVAAWDRDDLTERTRRRMPTESRWAARASADHALLSTLQVARTSEGLEETTRVWAELGGPGDARTADAALFARRLLARAADIGMPLLGIAFATIGAPDLAVRPLTPATPEPLALLVGPPGIRALGVDAASWVAQHGGTVVGSPRIPGALVPLGSVDGGGWTRLTEMLGTLDGTRLSALLGVAPEVAAALRTADADAAASSAAPAAPSSPRPGSEA